MAGGGVPGGGGKKSVNAELNLVPFIDLLSTLICFLLVTAVWAQVEALSTNSSQVTSNSSDNPPPPKEKKVELNVSLLMDYVEMAEGDKVVKVAHIGGQPDYSRLTQILNDWKTKYPDRSDLVLFSDSQAPYEQLIKLMDTMITAKFEDVGVNTN